MAKNTSEPSNILQNQSLTILIDGKKKKKKKKKTTTTCLLNLVNSTIIVVNKLVKNTEYHKNNTN